MNKKQKILTFVALVVFIVLGALHYLKVENYWYLFGTLPLKLRTSVPRDAIVPDVQMPWFVLGVIYTALLLLMQDKRGGPYANPALRHTRIDYALIGGIATW
jgi:hypothetical protein